MGLSVGLRSLALGRALPTNTGTSSAVSSNWRDNALGRKSASTTNDLDKRIAGAGENVIGLGGQIPEKKTSALGWLLENLPRTGYGATNMLREFTNGDSGLTPGEFDPLSAWGRGFSKVETPLGKDIMTDAGLNGDKGIFGGDPHIYNPSPAGMAGLALDIFNPADPLNWIGFGLGGAVKKGGIKGATALSKSFGSQGANIASLLGEEATTELGARTVGKLIKQVTSTGKSAGLDTEGMAKLVNYLKEGMTEAKVNPKTKLNYWQGKPITVGLQNPLTLGLKGNFAEVPIKGSEHLTAQVSKGINAFNRTKVGDTVGEMFDFNHVTKNAPQNLFIRDRAANDISKMIRDVRSGKTKLPVSNEQLVAIRESLKQMSVSNVYDMNTASGGINFDVMAGFTGIDSKTLLNLFDNELPFTYSIPELFTKLKAGGVPDADAFTQAAMLRGTMDKVVDLVPNEYRAAFKGTIMTPDAGVEFYKGSPGYGKEIRNTASPYVNFVFNHKGIDIALPVNTSENFNVDMWKRLDEAMKAIDGMPEGNIQKYKEQLQLAPHKIGHPDGGDAYGVTRLGQITLSDPKYYDGALAHEFGHVIHQQDVQAGGAFGNDYLKAASKDPKKYLSNYSEGFWNKAQMGGATDDIDEAMADALGEDIAEAFRLLREDPVKFMKEFPNRAAAVEKALADGKLTNDEIAEILARQDARKEKITTAYGADKQLRMIMDKLDSDTLDVLAKSGDSMINSKVAIDTMKKGYLESFERSAAQATDFVENTKKIFKDVSPEEMKKIIDLASSMTNEEAHSAAKFFNPNVDIKNRNATDLINRGGSGTDIVPDLKDRSQLGANAKHDNKLTPAQKKKALEEARHEAKMAETRAYHEALFKAQAEGKSTLNRIDFNREYKAKLAQESKPSFYSQINDEINPTYYSVLQKTVDERMPDSMKVPSLKNLFKQFGVTDEELKWTFMDEFFKGKDKVTKAEVQNWLDMNDLKVEEKILGEPIKDLKYSDIDIEAFKNGIPELADVPSTVFERAIKDYFEAEEEFSDNLWESLEATIDDNDKIAKIIDDFIILLEKHVTSKPQSYLPGFRTRLAADQPDLAEVAERFMGDDDLSSFFDGFEEGGYEQAVDDVLSNGTGIDEDDARRFVDVMQEYSLENPRMDPQDVIKRPFYESYVEPGGKEYRELLIKLPREYGVPKIEGKTVAKPYHPLSDAFGKDKILRVVDRESGEVYEGAASALDNKILNFYDSAEGIFLDGLKVYDGDKLLGKGGDFFSDKARRKSLGNLTEKYIAPHFDQENLLVHTRFNTRTTPDGKKILFIEEIQSDWHQNGYRAGYRGEGLNTLEKQQGDLINQLTKLRTKKDDLLEAGANMDEIDEVASEIEDMMRELRSIADTLDDTGERVPDAPYKETWRPLIMKRLLKYASEEGFDGVSWTSGAQQNKRWLQSKQAKYIGFSKEQNQLVVDTGSHMGQEVIDLNDKRISKYLTKDQIKYLTSDEPLEISVKKVESGLPPELEGLSKDWPDDLMDVDPDKYMDYISNPKPKVKEKYQLVDQHGNAMRNWVYNSKEAAQKALDDYKTSGQEWRYISNMAHDSQSEMLQFGGGGFRATYDQAIPDVMKSLTKKHKLDIQDLELGGAPKNEMLRDYFDDGATVDDIESALSDYIFDADEFDDTTGSLISDWLTESLDSNEFLKFSSDDATYVKSVYKDILKSFVDEDDAPIELVEEARKAIDKVIDARIVDSMDNSVKMSQKGIIFTPEAKDFYKGNSFPKFLKQDGPNPDLEKVNTSLDGLSENAQNAFREFIKWRESIVKEYEKREIPINTIEKYVPFIFIRKGNSDEMDMLGSLFGTGSQPKDDEISSLINWLSGSDPNLKGRTTQALNPGEVNKLLKKPILSEDAGVIMATRGVRGIRALELYDFGDEMAKTYGMTIDEMATFGHTEGYKLYVPKVSADGRRTFEEVTNNARIIEGDPNAVFMPEDLVKVYNNYADLVFGERGMNNLLKTYDKATSIYKKFAYLWNPGHIIRDFTGNVFNGYLMGLTSPKIYTEAVQYLSNPDMLVKIPGYVDMTAKEFTKKCREHGILDIGSALGEYAQDGVVGTKKNANAAVKALRGYDWAMREGTKRSDTFTRMAGMIYNLRKGLTFEESAVQVKKFYFDYFELTSFERKVMKRIVPFYTWMRKNIPLQLEMLVKNPREYARISDVMNAANEGPIDWSEQPEYIQENGAFPVANSDSYIAPNLPFSDISRGAPTLDTLQNLLSSVNPLLKAPVELATNTQWFSGQPVEKYDNEQRDILGAGLLEALGINTPTVNKRGPAYLLDQLPLLRNLDAVTDPGNPRQMEKTSSFLGGPGIYKKDKVQTSAQYDTLDQLNALIQAIKAEQLRGQK